MDVNVTNFCQSCAKKLRGEWHQKRIWHRNIEYPRIFITIKMTNWCRTCTWVWPITELDWAGYTVGFYMGRAVWTFRGALSVREIFDMLTRRFISIISSSSFNSLNKTTHNAISMMSTKTSRIVRLSSSYHHITKFAMALIHQSSAAPYIHVRNTIIVIKSC